MAVHNTNKKVVFKNSAPFTSCITETNNRQVYLYNNAYSKITGSLWQYYRDEPAIEYYWFYGNLNSNSNIIQI